LKLYFAEKRLTLWMINWSSINKKFSENGFAKFNSTGKDAKRKLIKKVRGSR
jgi:hypothetical protein